MKKFLVMVLAAAAVWAGCSKPEAADVKVRSLQMTSGTATVQIGQTTKLAVIVAPSDATNKGVNWSSSDEAIATVNDEGVVTGVSDGTVVITATAKDGSGAKATCTVTVGSGAAGVVKVTSITLTEVGALTLQLDAETAIEAIVEPDNATNKEVEWVFSNPSVAEYADGKIIAKAEGKTDLVVKAKDGSNVESDVLKIEVKAPAKIFAKYKKIVLREGQNLSGVTGVWAYYGTEDAFEDREDIANPVWTSGNDAVVTVSGGEVCNVTSVGPGETVITVSDGLGASLEIPVVVTPLDPVTSAWLPGIELISPTQLYDAESGKGWYAEGDRFLGEGYASGTECFHVNNHQRSGVVYRIAQCKFDKVDVSSIQNPALYLRIYISDVSKLMMDGANSQIELASEGEDWCELTWTGGRMFNNWPAHGASANYQLKDGWNTIVLPFDYAEVTGGAFNPKRTQWFRMYHNPNATYDLTGQGVEIAVDQLRVIDWTEYVSTDEGAKNFWLESGTANNWAAGEWKAEHDGHTGVFGYTDEFLSNTISNYWLRNQNGRWGGRVYSVPVNMVPDELKFMFDLWVDDPTYFNNVNTKVELCTGSNMYDDYGYAWGFNEGELNLVAGWNTITCPFPAPAIENTTGDPDPRSLYTFRIVLTNQGAATAGRHSYYVDNLRIVKK